MVTSLTWFWGPWASEDIHPEADSSLDSRQLSRPYVETLWTCGNQTQAVTSLGPVSNRWDSFPNTGSPTTGVEGAHPGGQGLCQGRVCTPGSLG